MKQEDKSLLLKDLCARLPYGVHVQHRHFSEPLQLTSMHLSELNSVESIDATLEDVKPYLFPLSSMTEEQFNELKKLGYLENCVYYREIPFKLKWIKTFSLPLLHWLLENHFDINDLIEKGLAIDATGLNIY